MTATVGCTWLLMVLTSSARGDVQDRVRSRRPGGSSCGSDAAADLGRRWVGQCRSIAEENCRYGEISVVDVSDDRRAIGMGFDVDLSEVDSGAREL
jgi:hypothetical protein